MSAKRPLPCYFSMIWKGNGNKILSGDLQSLRLCLFRGMSSVSVTGMNRRCDVSSAMQEEPWGTLLFYILPSFPEVVFVHFSTKRKIEIFLLWHTTWFTPIVKAKYDFLFKNYIGRKMSFKWGNGKLRCILLCSPLKLCDYFQLYDQAFYFSLY